MPLTFSSDFPFFTKHEDALKISVCIQLVFLLLSSITLDGGALCQRMLLAATAYWLSLVIIMVRRNGNVTRGDKIFLAWGFPIMIVLTTLVASIVPVGALRH